MAYLFRPFRPESVSTPPVKAAFRNHEQAIHPAAMGAIRPLAPRQRR